MAIKFGIKAATQIVNVVRAFEAEVKGDGQPITPRSLLRQSILDVIYITSLTPAANVLTQPAHATVVFLRQIAFAEQDADNELVPNPNLLLKVIGRSKSRHVVPGSIGQIGFVNGEWRPLETDCEASEEGIQVVVEVLGFGLVPMGSSVLGAGVL